MAASSFVDPGLHDGTTYYYVIRAVNQYGTESAASVERSVTPSASRYGDAVQTTAGLRAYWRLGEASGTTAADEGDASPGSYWGGVELGRPGAVGGDTAARFDGVNDELTVSGSGLTLRSGGSIEGWFLWESGVALMRDSSNEWALAFDKSGMLAYRVGAVTFTTSRTTASVRGAWHHIVLTVDNGATKLYLDGTLLHSASGAGAFGVQLPWHVMRNGTTNQFARGLADEVAIYDTALSAATVAAHFDAAGTGEPPPAPTGLTAAALTEAVRLDWSSNPDPVAGYNVQRSTTPGGPYTQLNATPLQSPGFTDAGLAPGQPYYYVVTAVDQLGRESAHSSEASATPSASHYASTITSTPGVRGFWRLGEGSGSGAADELGASPGVFSGGPVLGVAGALVEPDTAARFDGVNDEMSVSGAALGLGSAGSLEGWFRWEAGAAPLRDSTSSGGWILAFDNGGKLAYRAGGATFTTGLATASVRDGGWHHLVLTLEGGRTGFYVDGVLVHSRTGVVAAAAQLPWHVMRNGSTTQFARGVADEVAIYDRALPAATITSHYHAASGG